VPESIRFSKDFKSKSDIFLLGDTSTDYQEISRSSTYDKLVTVNRCSQLPCPDSESDEDADKEVMKLSGLSVHDDDGLVKSEHEKKSCETVLVFEGVFFDSLLPELALGNLDGDTVDTGSFDVLILDVLSLKLSSLFQSPAILLPTCFKQVWQWELSQ
jgi:hypothetical protein